MSLKKVHILFITLASLCCLGFGLWCFAPGFDVGMSPLSLQVTGATGILLGCAVAVYGMWFYRNKVRGQDVPAHASNTR